MKTPKRAKFLKSLVVYTYWYRDFLLYHILLQLKLTTAKSQILNFKLTNGQLIFHISHKQSTLVEIYATSTFASYTFLKDFIENISPTKGIFKDLSICGSVISKFCNSFYLLQLQKVLY